MEQALLEKEISVENLSYKLEQLYELSKDEISKIIKSGGISLVIPYNNILSVDHKLAEELLNNPKKILQILSEYFTKKLSLEHKINVRVKDLPDTHKIRIRDIRSTHLGKLIETEGIIKISSEVRPVVIEVLYYHTECGGRFWYKTANFKLEKPTICEICRRTTGKFIELDKKTIDVQRLLIEELPEQIEKGEQPAQIVVILTEDLCEPKMERKTIPGTRVKVTGIVEAFQTQKTKAIMDVILNAVYIEPLEKDIEDVEISEEDLIKIREIAKSGDALSILAKSIAPYIHGKQYEHIKKAIVLQLIGGVKRIYPEGGKSRGDIHILLVGDPGTGKSQTLKYVADVAPRGRYVVGTTASSVGLTASVRRDEILKGGWVLEAGALVLASDGVVCIDELDKIPKEEIAALHEAMEQQTVTVDKANIHATLRAETAILAAANPKFGRWDKMKSIADQIDLPPQIINRFDLIFVLKDEPDEELDSIVVDGVLESLSKPTQGIIPKELLRKYILYAKKIIPEWTEEAKERVKEFYLTLRKLAKDQQTIPITARQLQSLIRLAEASARIRLSKKVTEEDVEIAKDLLMKSLKEVGINPETQTIDIDIIVTGVSSTQRERLSKIYDIIKDLQKDFPNGVPFEEIVNAASKYGIEEAKVKEVIERLLREGEIYEVKPNHYKLIS